MEKSCIFFTSVMNILKPVYFQIIKQQFILWRNYAPAISRYFIIYLVSHYIHVHHRSHIENILGSPIAQWIYDSLFMCGLLVD